MIVTLVELETADGVTYPVTKLFRIEFDNKAAMGDALASLQQARAIVFFEQLHGEEVK